MPLTKGRVGQNADSADAPELVIFVFLDPARCSELETVRGITAAVTIIFCLATIISFIGSTYGCIGTFCAPAVIFYFETVVNKVVDNKQHNYQRIDSLPK